MITNTGRGSKYHLFPPDEALLLCFVAVVFAALAQLVAVACARSAMSEIWVSGDIKTIPIISSYLPSNFKPPL